MPKERKYIDNPFLMGQSVREFVAGGRVRSQNHAQAVWNQLIDFAGLPGDRSKHIFAMSRRSAPLVSALPIIADLLGSSLNNATDHFVCMKALPLVNGRKERPEYSQESLFSYARRANEFGWVMAAEELNSMARSSSSAVSYMY